MYLSKFNYKIYGFVFLCFAILQILLVKVLYDNNQDVGEDFMTKIKISKIHFLNDSISEHEYDQLFRDFCQIESHKAKYIQNLRVTKDYIGIFVPVFNLNSDLVNSTLHQLSLTSQNLKLSNSITLVFDMSKKNCNMVTSISQIFKFDIKIGFLKFIQLPIFYKNLYNITRLKNDSKFKKKIKNYKIKNFNSSINSYITYNSVQNNSIRRFLKKHSIVTQNKSINSVDITRINMYIMYLISNLFNNSFEFYLHLSESSRMDDSYLSSIVDFLLNKESTSRHAWYFVEFGSQEFPSGLAIRTTEVKRFATFILNMGVDVSNINKAQEFNSKDIFPSVSLIEIYSIYLKILSQNHRIIYLPPIFHSTNPKFLSLPDPNPLAHVFTTLNILNNKELILFGGGLVADHPKSGDQIVILFVDGIILDSLQWKVTVDCNHTNLVLFTKKSYQYFKSVEKSNSFKFNRSYRPIEFKSGMIKSKDNYKSNKFKNKSDQFNFNKNNNISVDSLHYKLNYDENEELLHEQNSYLEAFIEVSPTLMSIDKKLDLAKCAEYQLIGSLINNKFQATNLTRLIGRITTRCLKLTIVKNLNCLVTYGRISIKLLKAAKFEK